MRKLTVLLFTICFTAVAVSCSNAVPSETSVPETSAEETTTGIGGTVKHVPAPTAEEFRKGFIDPIVEVHIAELGYGLKLREATIEVFKFITDNLIFMCDFDEVSQNLQEAVNTMDSDELNTFKININEIAGIIDDVKIGNEETIRSFDDIDAADTVRDYIADPATYESWLALQTIMRGVS